MPAALYYIFFCIIQTLTLLVTDGNLLGNILLLMLDEHEWKEASTEGFWSLLLTLSILGFLKRSIEKTCLWCGWDIRNTQYLETYNHVLLKLIFCISSPLSHTFSSFRKMWLVSQEDGGKCWLVNDLWPSQTMPGLISHCQISSNSRLTVSTLTEYNDLERDWPLLAKFTHELFLF